MDGILKGLKRMKVGKAAGYDKVSSKVLKGGGNIVASLLCQFFNKCWKSHRVPNDLCKPIKVKDHDSKNTKKETVQLGEPSDRADVFRDCFSRVITYPPAGHRLRPKCNKVRVWAIWLVVAKQTLSVYYRRSEEVTCHIKKNVDIVEWVDIDDAATFLSLGALESKHSRDVPVADPRAA
ncbi:hypothetical protein EVAR_82856_1 [Eumeta japonica]|uniref:Uncharacterized protein n=1 Tax=Eumeta variegata TaxID=151549 RepID=A0A4C1V401_EUMVA|nr:hypothetical protein EVAR_82856_1 [Eumeta japonica]